MKKLTSYSGSFWVDDNGLLCRFECAEKNYFKPLNNPNYRDEKHLEFLYIPEGVTALPRGAFDGYKVFGETNFPETLSVLGDSGGGVFRHCQLSDLKLSKKMDFVGEDSFFLSAFAKVWIPDEADAQTVQTLVHLFRNHTYHHFLFYPVEKIRDLPPLKVPVRVLRNKSGDFYVDKRGVLQSFRCSLRNNAEKCWSPHIKTLYTLHIPEGVTVLKEGAFRWYTVLDQLTLPDSLRLMGTGDGCAFANCSLPDVEIPKTLQILGTFSFGAGSLSSLRLPENADWFYARQFKESKIGTLYLNKKYSDESNHLCIDGAYAPGYLGNFLVNNVSIGNIVWLE